MHYFDNKYLDSYFLLRSGALRIDAPTMKKLAAQTDHQNSRWLTLLATLSLCTTQLHAAGTPEYISATSTSADSLEDANNATDTLGFNNVFQDLRSQLKQIRDLSPKTGVPFIDDTTFQLTSRSYYMHREFGDGKKAETFATGGSFGLKSGHWLDIASIGLTTYTSQKLYGPDGRDGTGLLKPGQKSYTLMGEAYIDLQFEPAQFAFGYQRLDLPYLNGHDIRMTPNTFEAYTSVYQISEGFEIGLGYVDKIRTRTSYDYQSMSERAGALGSNEGVYAVGMRYKIDERFNIGWVDLYNPDTFNTFYIESSANFYPSDDIEVKTALQFTDQRSVDDELAGDFQTQHYGAKCATTYGNLNGALVYTYTASDHRIRKPWGGSPSYNSIMIGDFDRAGESAYGVGLGYDFTARYIEGFSTSVKWVYGDASESDQRDQQEINLNLDYRPEHIENLWLRLRYGDHSSVGSSDEDIEDFRIIINYAVAF